MSNYSFKAVHKETGKLVNVYAMDDYYGQHIYGYRVVGEDYTYGEKAFSEQYERVEE